MLKQALIFTFISILVIIFSNYAHNLIVYIHSLFIYIKNLLLPLFLAIDMGPMLQKICLLILIPMSTAGIPALIYRLVRGQQMPYLIELTWILWLVLVLSTILIH